MNLFALSSSGKINYLDVSTGTTLFSWRIHGSTQPGCIALARNDMVIAASDGSSVSFWDTTTHEQIGSIIKHTAYIKSMAISTNYDLAMSGGKAITLRNIFGVLPSTYYENVSKLA